MAPTVGRIVHYTISEYDATTIAITPTGSQAHNEARVGNVYPAIVVSGPYGPDNLVNLQVFLDGDCSYWATSRPEGDGPGQWSWPPRA